MATVSVCMIVKNEEKVLKRCLDSLKGIWDELIIVDTGSTDSTKAIASLYTDKIYDFEWIDDFSAARNFAMKKAACEYIYMADADEILDEVNRERFLVLKENLLPEIEIVEMWYCNQLENGTVYNFDRELRPKLYRRLREFTFIEPVHETVRLDPVVFDSDIEIIHKPLNVHAGRDIKIFEKVINREGGLSDRLTRMYATELCVSGEAEDFKNAVPYFEGLLDKAENEGNAEIERLSRIVLSEAAAIDKDASALMKYALKDIAGGGCSEVCSFLGAFYESAGDYREAALWYYNARYEETPEVTLKYGTSVPLKGLIRCAEKLGDFEAQRNYEEELDKL